MAFYLPSFGLGHPASFRRLLFSSLLFSRFPFPPFFPLNSSPRCTRRVTRYIFRFNSPPILMASLNLRGSTFSAPAGFYGPFVFIHFADLSHFGRFWISFLSLPSRFRPFPSERRFIFFYQHYR